ncbi:disease resistance protein RUN1-like isoform X2 [Juglans regia]|uniref:Disease resistance protein RUN1-like isoform X2 n=1 Tax=Juglans regia TaxID=51240 RepID=A0A6P9EF58_JUGRE|nr:disease resistance protein RUN1-like isoform X2 [Juglans regia]
MAFQSGASSSSSPTSSPPIRSCNHDVFLSFRGEDVRGNFISHLYKVLVQRGINTYIDNNLERGEEISPVLFKAIEESMISIIVLSKNYAESRWCLDELLKILDCKETKKQIVLPIFFQVDPSEVRHQNGIFGKSFDKLGDKFKDNVKMLKWKEALEKVSHISGFSSAKFGNESECIEKIVQEVSSKLPNRTCLHVANYPIGLESHVEGINMLLCIEFINETRMIGIFGTGGIGKTTTAKEVYNCIADQFEGSCFLVNVSENSKPDKGGLVKLQKKILSDILRDPKVEVDDVDRGINMIQEKLCCKKVLLVLDDIDCLDQLEKLSGRSDWFGLGSRIIITTRDKHILVQHDVGNWIYPMNEMDAKDALKLFSWHAFKRDQPDNDFVELTELALQYAGGLPLALTVVGSNLRGRDIPFWRCELEKYQRIPHKKIYDILKISFDGLDDFEKDIFLDIACFFKGDKREYVTKILDSCGFFAYAGIKNLNDKCLITIDEHDRLMMHDLLEDMGKEIVRQESPKEPGKRSRLWFYEDVLEVLEKNKNLTSMDLSCCYNLTNISDLSSCSNLQKLILSGCGSLVEVHDSVGFLNKLVELDFINCFNLKKLPRSFKLRCLVLLQLRGCKSLEYFPEIECKMEHLKCVEISSTVIQELPPSITNLIGLNMLYLQGCESLVHLPINIFQLERLKDVQIKDCPNFVNLVAEVGHNRQSMPCTQPPKSNNSLRTLNLSGSGIVSLSPCIEGFVGLSKLDLSYCRQLEEILHLPPNIEEVLAKRCSSLKNFLPESNNLFRTYNLSSSLKTLNLSFSGIVSLSPCIEGFVGLSKLNLSDCKQLEEILHLPPNIKEVDVRGCVLLERFPHVSTECSFGTPDLKRLTRINLSECNKVEVDVGNNAPDPLLVQEHFREKDSFRIIYPGSRIPEWFKYCKETTSFTNSIEIEIDHNASMCFGHQIVALVLCSVVGCYPMRFDQIIISINGQSMFNEYNNAISTDPHCVLLQYKVGSSIDRVLSRSYRKNNMRFEFRTISNNAIFKSVGVHLVYGN